MNIKQHPKFKAYFADIDTGEVYSTKQGKMKKLSPETNNCGYLRFVIYTGEKKTVRYLVSRFVWECAHKKLLGKKEIDHRDMNKLNNNHENLRIASDGLNSLHRVKFSKGNYTSNYIGVAWDIGRQAWHAYLSVNGKRYSAGFFATEIDAAKARNRLVVEHVKPGFQILNEVA